MFLVEEVDVMEEQVEEEMKEESIYIDLSDLCHLNVKPRRASLTAYTDNVYRGHRHLSGFGKK